MEAELIVALRNGYVNPDDYPDEIAPIHIPGPEKKAECDTVACNTGAADGTPLASAVAGNARIPAAEESYYVGKHRLLTAMKQRHLEIDSVDSANVEVHRRHALGVELATTLMRGWSPATHHWHHDAFRTAVKALLLVSIRLDHLWCESLEVHRAAASTFAAAADGGDAGTTTGGDRSGCSGAAVTGGIADEGAAEVLPPELWLYILRFLTRSSWSVDAYSTWERHQMAHRAQHPLHT